MQQQNAEILNTAIKVGHAMHMARKRPFTDVQVRLLAVLCHAKEHPSKADLLADLLNESATKIVKTHLDAHRIEVTDEVLALIGIVAPRPAIAVMYAAACRYLQATKGRGFKGPITVDHMAQLFKDGFPAEDELERIWRAQKGAKTFGSNYLDTKEAWI